MPTIEITHFHLDNCTVNQTLHIGNGTYITHEMCVVCDTEGSGGLVILGILIGLLASVGINLGQNIQALGAKEAQAIATAKGLQESNPCSSKKWIVGLTIFIVGSLGNMVAMAFASATILVPLESSQVCARPALASATASCAWS